MPLWLEFLIPTITGLAGIGIGMMIGIPLGAGAKAVVSSYGNSFRSLINKLQEGKDRLN